MTSKKLVSQDDRNAADFGLDRIGDEAFVMCLVVHFMVLAPDIVESILAGQAFADISLQHCRKGIPVFWEEQRRVLKSTAAHDLEAVANQ